MTINYTSLAGKDENNGWLIRCLISALIIVSLTGCELDASTSSANGQPRLLEQNSSVKSDACPAFREALPYMSCAAPGLNCTYGLDDDNCGQVTMVCNQDRWGIKISEPLKSSCTLYAPEAAECAQGVDMGTACSAPFLTCNVSYNGDPGCVGRVVICLGGKFWELYHNDYTMMNPYACGGSPPQYPQEDQTDEPVAVPLYEQECIEDGWEWYSDPFCYDPPSDNNCGTTSFCIKRCISDDDCTGTGLPYCRAKGVSEGGDNSCNGTIQVCSDQDLDEC